MSEMTWRDAQAAKRAGMTTAEREEYDAAAEDSELMLRLAELVYSARMRAGLSQSELAARMGTRQPLISAIEGGAQVPTVAMLSRVARATGSRLQVDILADAS